MAFRQGRQLEEPQCLVQVLKVEILAKVPKDKVLGIFRVVPEIAELFQPFPF
jgi:hypothetical protein